MLNNGDNASRTRRRSKEGNLEGLEVESSSWCRYLFIALGATKRPRSLGERPRANRFGNDEDRLRVSSKNQEHLVSWDWRPYDRRDWARDWAKSTHSCTVDPGGGACSNEQPWPTLFGAAAAKRLVRAPGWGQLFANDISPALCCRVYNFKNDMEAQFDRSDFESTKSTIVSPRDLS